MASVKVLLRKENKDKDYGYIKVRVIENRKTKFKSLGIKLKEKDWNEKLERVRKSHPQHEEINNTIEQKLHELREYHYDIYAVNDNTKSIFSYYEEVINITTVRGTRDKYIAIRNLFRKYIHSIDRKDFRFHELTKQRVAEFHKWMRENGISQNTANYNLKSFKAIINRAKKSNIHRYVHDPFEGFKFTFTKRQNKGLNEVELEKLISTQYKDPRDFSYSRRNDSKVSLSEINQIFLFQLFAQGMRVSDVLLLRWSHFRVTKNGVFIDYVMRKTKKEISVFLNEVAMQLLHHRIIKYFKNFDNAHKELSEHIDSLRKCIDAYDEALAEFKELTGPANKIKDPKLRAATIWKEYYDEVSPKVNKGERKLSPEKRSQLSVELKMSQAFELVEKVKAELNASTEKLRGAYEEAFLRLSTGEDSSTHFVFHFLKNEDFKDIKSNDFSILNDTQYLRLCGQRSYYNTLLKEIQKQAGIQTRLTSHVARHTYTQLLLDDGSADLADISKSLGHTHLSTTQAYIARFPSERVSKLSTNLSDKYKGLF